MRIIYFGHESVIHKKLQETMSGIVSLKLHHERKDGLCTYDSGCKMFESCFINPGEAYAYLSDIVDFLKVGYLLHHDYAEEIKSQLLNKDYLASEFIRLRGNASEPTHSCDISCAIM